MCSFYCPPTTTKKTKEDLINHIIETWHKLKMQFPSAGVILAGDANHLQWDKIVKHDKSLKQIVKDPTRGDKILDVVITDLWRYYQRPTIISAVPVDDGKKGVKSDHSGVLLKLIEREETRKKEFITRIIQPMPKSLIHVFGERIMKEEISFRKKKMLMKWLKSSKHT